MPNTPKGRKPFWMKFMVLLSEEAQVEARLSLFRDSVNLDAICTVCMELARCSKIKPDGTPR